MESHRPGTPPSEPQRFSRYNVCSLLGEGAMGRVYLADDPVLDRRVAIKVIAVDKLPEGRPKEEFLKRFNLEARACARLSHPSIVAVFDAGEQNGVPWIAFEYVDGDRLEEMIAAPKLLSVEKILSITLDITAALHHAHEYGIIHRDIKPANILIDKRTHIAKLSDFGVVKAPWVALTQDGSAVGSPGYMAPEQLDGSGIDARSDLFSLGIVLYQMLTGNHPFLRPTIPATIYATLHGNYKPVSELRPDAPPYLSEIVDGLLMTDRRKRTRTAAQLLHKLRSNSRKGTAGQSAPAASGDEAFLGNTTRIKRISHTLQALRKRGLYALSRSPRVTSWLTALQGIGRSAPHSTGRPTFRIPLPDGRRQPLFIVIPTLFLFFFSVALLLIRFSTGGTDERAAIRELRREGLHGTPQQLIDTCSLLINQQHFTEANKIAAKLTRLRRVSSQARMLIGRTALLEGDDSTAVEAFTAAANDKKWPRIRKRALPQLLRDCAARLTESSADSALTGVLAAAVFIVCKDSIRSWIVHPAYWLRWNSVRLAAHLAIPVDSVKVYILDLQHAGSVRTRTRAATRLGELGDRRAIPPLTTAAGRGLRDPVVSYTAELVLENYFKDPAGGK
ncbi:MAG: serine/threonine protein kinase [Chitinispirillaceae bacterium]|nr:serine/threonine protein kinase [Chitinispirillaceae bacterium]